MQTSILAPTLCLPFFPFFFSFPLLFGTGREPARRDQALALRRVVWVLRESPQHQTSAPSPFLLPPFFSPFSRRGRRDEVYEGGRSMVAAGPNRASANPLGAKATDRLAPHSLFFPPFSFFFFFPPLVTAAAGRGACQPSGRAPATQDGAP